MTMNRRGLLGAVLGLAAAAAGGMPRAAGAGPAMPAGWHPPLTGEGVAMLRQAAASRAAAMRAYEAARHGSFSWTSVEDPGAAEALDAFRDASLPFGSRLPLTLPEWPGLRLLAGRTASGVALAAPAPLPALAGESATGPQGHGETSAGPGDSFMIRS